MGKETNHYFILLFGVALLLSLSLVAAAQQQQRVTALEMTGQQYFANGTGIAYFDDGTTMPFNHTITPGNGYYYDNSTATAFLSGEIPGHEINDTIGNMNDPTITEDGTLGATGDIINVTIANGADFLGNRSIQPSNIIKAKVGDAITFTNNDSETHIIISPPSDPSIDSKLASSANFNTWIFPGQNYTLIMTRPGALHYEFFGDDIKGAMIVEEREEE
jgi:hypothetical protein